MKITEITGGSLMLEATEEKIQGLLNNSQKIAAVLKRVNPGRRRMILSVEGVPFRDGEPDLPAQDQDRIIAEYVLRELAEFDPTPNSKYLNWLVQRFSEGDVGLHRNTVRRALTGFERYRKQLDRSDINQYRKIDDVATAVEPLLRADAPASARQQRARDKAGDFRKGEIKTLIDGARYRVHVPLSQAAMNYLAWLNVPKENLEWCTLTGKGEQFGAYHKKGTVYQISVDLHSNNPRKFLVHYEEGEFMDENDDPISNSDIAMLSEFPEHRQFLEMLVNKHYGKYLSAS